MRLFKIRRIHYSFGRRVHPRVKTGLLLAVFLAGSIVSVFRLMPVGAINQEQTGNFTCTASGSATATCTVSIASATANNLLIIICSGVMSGGAPTLSATGYTSAVGPTTTSNIAQEIYYKVAAGGETSVSCAIDGANNKRGLITVFEYSGMVTASIVDQVATPNTGTGTTATTGTTPTTTNASDLLIAGITVDADRSFSGWTNSFTEQSDHPNTARQGTAALTVSSTGTYSTGATLSGSGTPAWIGQIVAFKGAAAAGPIYPYLTQEGYIFENDDGSAGSAAVELIKTGENQCSGTTTCTATVNFTAATADNLLIVVCSGLGQTDPPTLSGTGYTSAVGPTTTSDTAQEVLYKVSTGGETSVSCTATVGSGNNVAALATFFEYSGTATSSVVDQVASSTGSSTNPATGTTPTTTNASDLLIGAVTIESDSTFSTWSNGFSEQSEQSFNGGTGISHGIADKLVTATGTYATDAIATVGDPWIGQIVAFKSSGGGSEAADATKLAGSEFSSGKTLSDVRRGERLNLRTQITNSGAALNASDELALFYDRNDGIWTKVKNAVPPDVSAGTCSDSSWDCETVDDTGTVGEYNSIAVGPDGRVWASYYDAGSNDNLMVAQRVGSGGSGCDGGSIAWNCTVVDATGDVGTHSSIAVDSNGVPWVSYRDVSNGYLKVAYYVGSGGNCDTSGGSDAWQCTSVDTSANVGAYSSIALDVAGGAWVSYYNQSSGDLKVAEFVTSGGDCDAAGGSDAWNCTTIISTSTVGTHTSIAFDHTDSPWISFYDTVGLDLEVAQYVGTSGSGCASSAWTCTTVDATNDVGQDTSIAFDSSGAAWISYHDNTGSNLNLKVAKYVESTGNCDDTGGSDAWQCTTVDATGDTGWRSSIAVDAAGNPWITYRDSTGGVLELRLARLVGSGGNCDDTGGSDAWQCSTLDTSVNAGLYSSIAFGSSGAGWISYYDDSGENLRIANINRTGEISIASSQNYSGGDLLTESHSDMTSVSDTTSQGDADCLAGSTTWNDGSYSSSENASGLSLPAGDTTLQCTELMWTLDTSQALPGTTYRFVVAVKDEDNDNSRWRGVISVATDGYPTLSIRSDEETTYVYSKDSSYAPPDCSATGWGCEALTSLNRDLENPTIGFAPDGTAWIAGYASNASYRDLFVAEYVGVNGTGCTTDAWQCYFVSSSGQVGGFPDIAFAPDGSPWIAFNDTGSTDVEIARYVGSGGSCDDTRWECEEIASSSTFAAPSIAFDPGGTAWVRYIDGTNDDLYIANYVGAGGSGCATAAWNCVKIQDVGATVDNLPGGLAIDDNGKIYTTYIEGGTEDDAWIVEYVGAGGSGCTNPAWSCTEISNSNTGFSADIVLDGDGNPWVSYRTFTGSVEVAEYVGTGGTGCALAAWNCVSIATVASDGFPKLAVDSQGAPWLTFTDDGTAQVVAEYVGTGGTGCSSSAWSCTDVDTTNTAMQDSDIAFDSSGTPWVAYVLNTDEIGVAKMHFSPSPLSMSAAGSYNGHDGVTGHLRYILSSGLSPYGGTYSYPCGGVDERLGYCGLFSNDDLLDSITAVEDERPIYAFSTRYGTNSMAPSARVSFQTTQSPASQNVALQIYRFGTTNAWETVSTYSSAGCDTANCTIIAEPTSSGSEYLESDGGYYWAHYRLYQEESTTDPTTLYIDSFYAIQTQQQLRHGRIFRDAVTEGLRW